MKVVQIVKTNQGAKWAFEQAKWLFNNGVDIVTILPEIQGGMAEKYLEEGMQVMQCDFSLPLAKPWSFFSRKKKIQKMIDEIQPDLIHLHFVTNAMMTRISLKNSQIPRFFQIPGPLHLENKVFRSAELMLSNKRDFWGPSCKRSEELLIQAGLKKDKVFLTYYGGYGGKSVNEYRGKVKYFHERFNIDSDKILVGMVSYFYKPKKHLLQRRGLKGHEDFIDALSIVMEENPNVTGLIIGGAWADSKDYVEKIKKYSFRKCGDRIVFTGFIDNMKEVYRGLDIAVHPSHSENLGGAAESLAAGVPTISTNIGGFPDIVKDCVTGFTVRPKNPNELSKAIVKTINNMDKSLIMAKEGQELVRNLLDIENTASRIKEVYLEIVEGKNND